MSQYQYQYQPFQILLLTQRGNILATERKFIKILLIVINVEFEDVCHVLHKI